MTRSTSIKRPVGHFCHPFYQTVDRNLLRCKDKPGTETEEGTLLLYLVSVPHLLSAFLRNRLTQSVPTDRPCSSPPTSYGDRPDFSFTSVGEGRLTVGTRNGTHDGRRFPRLGDAHHSHPHQPSSCTDCLSRTPTTPLPFAPLPTVRSSYSSIVTTHPSGVDPGVVPVPLFVYREREGDPGKTVDHEEMGVREVFVYRPSDKGLPHPTPLRHLSNDYPCPTFRLANTTCSGLNPLPTVHVTLPVRVDPSTPGLGDPGPLYRSQRNPSDRGGTRLRNNKNPSRPSLTQYPVGLEY